MGLMGIRRKMLIGQKDKNIAYEARNLSFNGVNEYIDTGVYLFTQENINRDFEFIAKGIAANNSEASNTIICAKHK